MGGGRADSGDDDCLQDEFRALFPNVNISFGGRQWYSVQLPPIGCRPGLYKINNKEIVKSYGNC